MEASLVETIILRKVSVENARMPFLGRLEVWAPSRIPIGTQLILSFLLAPEEVPS